MIVAPIFDDEKALSEALFGNKYTLRVLAAIGRFGASDFTATDVGVWIGFDRQTAFRVTQRLELGGLLKRRPEGLGGTVPLERQASPLWKSANNRSVLRNVMAEGRPIRDASVDSAGNLLLNDTRRFITMERDFLRSSRWTYDPRTTLWSPPG